jgi:hypothetical protein
MTFNGSGALPFFVLFSGITQLYFEEWVKYNWVIAYNTVIESSITGYHRAYSKGLPRTKSAAP